jgi:hypothetical protein
MSRHQGARRSKRWVIVGAVALAAVCAAASTYASAAADEQPNGPEPQRVRELTESRTASSKTYELVDGRQEWVGYGQAVHYKDTQGFWQEIDNSVVADSMQLDGTGYAYRNGANSYTVRFQAKAGGARLVRIDYDGKSIAFGLVGARQSEGAKKTDAGNKTLTEMTYGESCLTYSEVCPRVDLVYEPKTYGVKEYLLLKESGG